MKYFDCHADTLTQVIKEGESLEKNTCDIDLQRIEKFADTYTQIFAIWKNRKEILPGTESSVFRKSYEKAIELLQKQKIKFGCAHRQRKWKMRTRMEKLPHFYQLKMYQSWGKT